MIYEKEPEGFNPRFEVVSCFVEYKGEIILLERPEHKPEGGTWGVPAGKVEEGEKPLAAMIRELWQETKLKIPKSKIKFDRKVYVRYPDYDFVYHIFHALLDARERIKINPKEHEKYMWIAPEKALVMENTQSIALIRDLDACIRLFYRI